VANNQATPPSLVSSQKAKLPFVLLRWVSYAGKQVSGSFFVN